MSKRDRQSRKRVRDEGKRRVRLGVGADCPKCGQPMARYKHPDGWEPKKKQVVFYWYWDLCHPCQHTQHYEEAKALVANLVLWDL